MGIVNFVKYVGLKLGTGNRLPSAAALKKNLDSYHLGTEKVRIKVEDNRVFLKGTIASRDILEKTVLAVGNIHGIAVVDTTGLKIAQGDGTSEITHQGQLVYYVVRHDDDLHKIAEKIYGKEYAFKERLIFNANRPMLAAPDKLYPGQLIRIPVLQE